ncbi:Hypothetical predicted protein [Mytilus galloprovincialis]|uniref:CCHC-type domain-containing protein n=1 Tax=Mytilus galloprovincialis TaxID=29158 RepID=A0A8B6G0J1_MYTGA|nr:Hypothetical predicted protein [Mytilus galloprovincialis]
MHLCSFTVSEVEWYIESKYIINGKDTLLNCNGTSCLSRGGKKWIGGRNYELLSFNNVSTNSTKYEITVDTTLNYGLKIKNMSFDDFNSIYTCVCGLQQYSRMLDTSYVVYIYPPYIATKTINKEFLKVEMDVYPLQKCHLRFTTPSRSNIIVLNTVRLKEIKKGRSEIYKVAISHSLLQEQIIDCKGYVDVFCEVGPLNYTIINRHHLHGLDNCKDQIVVNPYAKCNNSLQTGHKQETCNNDWVCNSCGKSGHKAKECLQPMDDPTADQDQNGDLNGPDSVPEAANVDNA